MDMKLDVNDIVQVLVHMMADNLATLRVQGETLVMLSTPDAALAASTIVSMRQRIRVEMETILNKIYENYGKVDIRDILNDDPQPE